MVGGLTLDKGNVRPGKTTSRKHNQGLDIAVLTTLRWQGESDAIKRLKKTIHVPMRYPKESQMYARRPETESRPRHTGLGIVRVRSHDVMCRDITRRLLVPSRPSSNPSCNLPPHFRRRRIRCFS